MTRDVGENSDTRALYPITAAKRVLTHKEAKTRYSSPFFAPINPEDPCVFEKRVSFQYGTIGKSER